VSTVVRSAELDGNVNKTPLVISLPQGATARAKDQIAALGVGLPCQVTQVLNPWCVEVGFAVNAGAQVLQPMTVPVAAPSYIAYPIQTGDSGMAVPLGARLGALSGLGGSTPNLGETAGNLSTLYFLWLGNASWTTLDPDALVLWNNLIVGMSALGFFGTAKVAQQTVTGALSAVTDTNAKAVLTSLIDALSAYGLVVDGTT
jgi:hypothetical protein